MDQATKPFYGWWITLTAFIFMMMIVGFVTYGLPQFYPDYLQEFGWRRDQIQKGNTLSKIIVGPLFGLAAGWAIERFGPRAVMIAGAFFASTALYGFSQMNSLTQLYAFFFFNALGYLCAGPLPCQTLIANWFTRLRGRMMGIAYVGIGLGGGLVAWIIKWGRAQYGWRGTMQLLALLIVVTLSLLALLLVRRRPADLGLLPDGANAADSPPSSTSAQTPLRLRDVVKTSAFWWLALGSVLSISAVGGITQNLPLYLTDIAKNSSEAKDAAALYPSLVLFASIAGRLTTGWLADRYRKQYVMIGIFLVIGLSIPLLIWAREMPVLLYVFALIFGFGLGADYMLIPLMTAECFGIAGLSRILGIIVMSDAVGEASMPWLVARLREGSGSYAGGFWMLSGIALLGALAILAIRHRDGKPVSRWQLGRAND